MGGDVPVMEPLFAPWTTPVIIVGAEVVEATNKVFPVPVVIGAPM